MPNQAPAHWSKDFVEHLRTVHFTLIALCVGLIVLASFPSKSEIQIAHDQASEILEVTNTWDLDLLETEAEKIVKADIAKDQYSAFLGADETSLSANFYLSWDNGTSWAKPTFNPRSWIMKIEIPQELRPDTFPVPFEAQLQVKRPSSIKSFQHLWDAFLTAGSISLPRMPGECIVGVVRKQFHSQGCAIHPLDSAHNAKPLAMSFSESNIEPNHQLLQNGQLEWNYQFSYQQIQATKSGIVTGQWYAIIPIRQIDFKQIELDGQKILIQQSMKWQQKHKRAFKDAFRELALVDGPFEDADISSAERILDAEAKRTGDAFEAVGLKIPAEVAVRCGVLLVLGVQLYLLIHLREFGNRLDREAGFEVAWIGVYSSRLARVMLLISLLLLPASTVVLLSIRGLTMTEHKRIAWAALAASNAASLTLAYFIFRALPQPPSHKSASSDDPLKKEPPESESAPEQTFE